MAAVELFFVRPSAFRPEIQALRAVAVLAVVSFHLWPNAIPGGYIGVDVFFVISGFLITSHLIRDADATGSISLAKFWARRVRRLLPAAYLVLLVSLAATWWLIPLTQREQNLRHIAGSALYVVNWVLAGDAVDYLAADQAPSLVQHYWTLSVEEQFYLVWPLLFVLAVAIAGATRSLRSMLWLVLGTLTLACFAYSLWVTETNPSLAYFATPARAWQFGAGALLALWISRQESGAAPTGRPTLAAIASWVGFAGVVAACFIFDASTPFPGTAALAPVAATLVVIAAGSPTSPIALTPVLSWRPVLLLGEISYAVYLWHWPPIVLGPHVLGRELNDGDKTLILLGTLALAWLTTRFVEDPLRSSTGLLRRTSVALVAAAVGASVLVGTSLTGQHQLDAQAQAAAKVAQDLENESPRCFGAATMAARIAGEKCVNPELRGMLVPDPKTVSTDFANYPGCFAQPHDPELSQNCTFGKVNDSDIPHVVLIGDSHARAWLPSLIRLTEQGQISLTAQLKSSCAWSIQPLQHSDELRVKTCTQWRASLARWLTEQADSIDVIITTANTLLVKGEQADRVDSFVRAWRPITKRGVPVVALRDNPRLRKDPNVCLAKTKKRNNRTCSTPRKVALAEVDPLGPAAAQVTHGYTLDFSDYYCLPKRCPTVIGGVNVYRDEQHLTTTYTKSMAPYLFASLHDLGLV